MLMVCYTTAKKDTNSKSNVYNAGGQMADKKRKKSNSRQTYRHHDNAICVVLFDPSKAPLPSIAKGQLEKAAMDIAIEHKVLFDIVTV
jgi:hypothetical protein